MPPPQLPADAPVALLAEPVEIRLRVPRREDSHPVVFDCVDRCLGEVLHLHEDQVVGDLGVRVEAQRERAGQVALGLVQLLLPGPARQVGVDAVVEGGVKELKMLAVIELPVRQPRLVQRPRSVMRVQDADVRHHLRALNRRGKELHFVPDMGDLLVHPVVPAPVVREHTAVKFFSPNPRVPPEEIEHTARTAGDQLVGEETNYPWTHERIHLLPIDMTGLLFHHPKAVIVIGRLDVLLFEGAEHVDLTGVLSGTRLDGGVAIHRHEVECFSHIEMIEVARQSAERGGHGDIRSDLVQDISLAAHKSHAGIAAKTHPIDH